MLQLGQLSVFPNGSFYTKFAYYPVFAIFCFHEDVIFKFLFIKKCIMLVLGMLFGVDNFSE